MSARPLATHLPRLRFVTSPRCSCRSNGRKFRPSNAVSGRTWSTVRPAVHDAVSGFPEVLQFPPETAAGRALRPLLCFALLPRWTGPGGAFLAFSRSWSSPARAETWSRGGIASGERCRRPESGPDGGVEGAFRCSVDVWETGTCRSVCETAARGAGVELSCRSTLLVSGNGPVGLPVRTGMFPAGAVVPPISIGRINRAPCNGEVVVLVDEFGQCAAARAL